MISIMVSVVCQLETKCASSDGSTFRGDDLSLPYSIFSDSFMHHRKQQHHNRGSLLLTLQTPNYSHLALKLPLQKTI